MCQQQPVPQWSTCSWPRTATAVITLLLFFLAPPFPMTTIVGVNADAFTQCSSTTDGGATCVMSSDWTGGAGSVIVSAGGIFTKLIINPGVIMRCTLTTDVATTPNKAGCSLTISGFATVQVKGKVMGPEIDINGVTTLEVSSSGQITAAGLSKETYSGAGGGAVCPRCDWGAAHGGFGGSCGDAGSGYRQDTYGSESAASSMGSCSGYSCSNLGGGKISLDVNQLILDGVINANAGPVTANGGGSGGSVKVRIGSVTFLGSGSITANGASSANAGSGGGGRIAILYSFEFPPNLVITADGGVSSCAGGKGSRGSIVHLTREGTPFSPAFQECQQIIGSDTCVFSSEFSSTSSQFIIAAGERFSKLIVKPGVLVRCVASMCVLKIMGFKIVEIHGTVEAPDLEISSVNMLNITQYGLVSAQARSEATTGSDGAGAVCPACDNGASHGGKGANRGCDGTYQSKGTYGNADMANTFGSCAGYYCGALGGGRISITVTNMALFGKISADAAQDSKNGGPSGGSVSIFVSDACLGTGVVSARGGSVSNTGAGSGGGGRVSVTANTILFSVDVSAGSGACANQQGKGTAGTYTSRCALKCNHGGARSDAACTCQCIDPWVGVACSECGLTCHNGGTLVNALDSCACQCPDDESWFGPTCLTCNQALLCNNHGTCPPNAGGNCASCDKDWYGGDCSKFCNAGETCSGAGTCLAGAGTCQCNAGVYGEDCSCNEVSCTGPTANSTCNAPNGYCTGNQCVCAHGWTGCKCDIPCSREVTCSGHGTCSFQGQCICDWSWSGPGCTIQDTALYCSNARPTKSRKPCLPGTETHLGWILDAATGEPKRRLWKLEFASAKEFVMRGKGYEIPDGVTCSAVEEQKYDSETEVFSSHWEFREELGVEVGIPLPYKLAKKLGPLSASVEYQQTAESAFSESHIYGKKRRVHTLYWCKIDDSFTPKFIAQFITDLNNASTSSGPELLKKWGTFPIQKVYMGGKMMLQWQSDSCALSSYSSQYIGVSIDALFVNLGNAGYSLRKGSGSSFLHEEWSLAYYGGTLVAGFKPDNMTQDAWALSIPKSPIALSYGLIGMDEVKYNGIEVVVQNDVLQHLESLLPPAGREFDLRNTSRPCPASFLGKCGSGSWHVAGGWWRGLMVIVVLWLGLGGCARYV